MRKLLLLLAVLLTALHASAYDFQVNGIYYNVISHSDMTCSVTNGDNRYFDSVTIPSRVTYSGNTYSVTSIGDNAFQYSGLTSVEIPNSVTSIGERAFYDCSSLTSVEIGNSVTTIGRSAFSKCSGLTSVEIPNSVTEIGEYAFSGCSGLTSVVIPNSVTTIGDAAFYRCYSLTSVEIGNSVTSIGDYAFYGCSGLTSVEIPNSVTTIGDAAFQYCSVWFGAVVRGDVAPITMGNRVNVQDCAVVHVTNTTGPTILEDDVTIGHNATVHACTIKKGALIGMNATVLDNAVVGEGAIVAAHALVLGGTQIGDHEIWGGVPAKFIKKTKPGQAESFAAHYVEYSKIYLQDT